MTTIVDQISKNLVDPEKHEPILRALVSILEIEGEKSLKDRIAQWIETIQEEEPPGDESEA